MRGLKLALLALVTTWLVAGPIGAWPLGGYFPGSNGIFTSITVGSFQGTVQSDTSTGTQDNFVINSNTTIIRWSGASAVTYDGFKCGASDCSVADSGREFCLITAPASTSTATLVNEAGGSTTTNRIWSLNSQNQVVSVSGSQANGAACFIYDGTSLRWRMTTLVSNQIAGTYSLNGALTVLNGNLFTAGSGGLTSTGKVTFSSTGHVTTNGTTPGISSCGTSPSIAGSDNFGRFTTGSAATTCTITFASTFTNIPSCIVETEGSATEPTYTTSATAITITVDIASTAYDYHCIGLI